MPATYTPISLQEMRATLTEANRWKESTTRQGGAGEYVYERELVTAPGVIIKVFSSISDAAGGARGAGLDAIRVCAIQKMPNGGTRGLVKSVSVKRTQNWRTTLMERIQEIFTTAKQRASW